MKRITSHYQGEIMTCSTVGEGVSAAEIDPAQIERRKIIIEAQKEIAKKNQDVEAIQALERQLVELKKNAGKSIFSSPKTLLLDARAVYLDLLGELRKSLDENEIKLIIEIANIMLGHNWSYAEACEELTRAKEGVDEVFCEDLPSDNNARIRLYVKFAEIGHSI